VGKITKYISSTSLLEKTFAYLKAHHDIHVVIVDADGQIEPLNGENLPELSFSKYYPVEFEKNIGGFRCSAGSEAALESADPHIKICLDGVQEVLLKDWILSQATDEILELSKQLHFLFNLASNLVGIQNLQNYTSIVLREISIAILADSAFAFIQGSHPGKELIVGYEMTPDDASLFRAKPAFLEIPEGTIAFTLEDQTSVLLAPIKDKESHIGFMVFLRTSEKRFFTSYEKKFLGIIDDIISPTIESMRLYSSLHDLYLNTVKALASAIDAKDSYTHGHSFRVAKYAVSIAKQMGVDRQQLNDLEIAAYMHDLGKIGVPEAILGKPGRLTPQEFEQVKKHPLITDQILEAIDLPAHIVDAAVQHHERLNGCGYPLGLVGDAISSFARIIAVADVFDALTSNRLYRDAMTVEDALTILYEGIDKEFDRNVVLALVSALQKEEKDLEISKLYPELKFLKIDQMNHFLRELLDHLLVGESDSIHDPKKILSKSKAVS
jgi:HD-GYP domain-containing protein (c-di-GMP phosphodiesterase class II)